MPTHSMPLPQVDGDLSAMAIRGAKGLWRRRQLVVVVGIALGAAAVIITACVMRYAMLQSAHHAEAQSALNEPELALCGYSHQETGYIKLPHKVDDHYFYWYVESQDKPTKDPLVLWLSGGPGCSSMMTLLVDNGPCKVQPDLMTTVNKYSWNAQANVIWLDQPSNVGFSYGSSQDADVDEKDVSANIYAFMQGFLAKHPELHDREFYITGESYAGHFVPSAAHTIVQHNKQLDSGSNDSDVQLRINLKGIAIGNGLVNPLVQMEYVLDMVNNTFNVTLVSDAEYQALKTMLPRCVELAGNIIKSGDMSNIIDRLGDCAILMNPFMASGRDPYDIRMPCGPVDDVTQCYDTSHIVKFLSLPDVQTHLNISHAKHWQDCNASIFSDFAASGDIFVSFESYVADLLNHGDIRVLVYAGDADTVCNWYGNKAWTTALEWEHKEEFAAAKDHSFKTSKNKVDAGVVKAYKNQFTFIRIFNAGHMVPRTQPAVALEMLNKFLAGEKF